MPFVLVFISLENKNILLFAMQLLIFKLYLSTDRLNGRILSPLFPLRVVGSNGLLGIWLLRNQVALSFAPYSFRSLVGSNGLGPSTSRLSGVCSNQLSYEPIYGGGNRVRTDDPLLAGQVLYQLSYTPIFLRSSQNKCPPCSREATLLKTNKKETIEFPID